MFYLKYVREEYSILAVRRLCHSLWCPSRWHVTRPCQLKRLHELADRGQEISLVDHAVMRLNFAIVKSIPHLRVLRPTAKLIRIIQEPTYEFSGMDARPRLPPEIFHEIVSHCKDDLTTLKALSCVNRVLYHVAAPLIFHTITAAGGRNRVSEIFGGLGSDGCLAVKHVRELVIRQSAALPILSEYNNVRFHQMSVELMKGLITFFGATGEHLERIMLDFACEVPAAALHIENQVVIGQIDALFVALGCQPLPCLTYFGINFLKPKLLRRLRVKNEPARAMSLRDPARSKFDEQHVRSNWEKITKLDITYTGIKCPGCADLSWESRGTVTDFVSKFLSSSLKDFKFIGSKLDYPHFYSHVEALALLLKDQPLVSLSLSRITANGLGSALSGLPLLENLSLSSMRVVRDGTPWAVTFSTDMCANLSRLKSLHVYQLSGWHDDCTFVHTVTLTTINPGDVPALTRLCDQVLGRKGRVTQGPEKEDVRDPVVDLQFCIREPGYRLPCIARPLFASELTSAEYVI